MVRCAFVALLFAGLTSCGGSLQSQQPPAKWSTGFWTWDTNTSRIQPPDTPVDVLFVHVGRISKDNYMQNTQWHAYGAMPAKLPPAAEYWVVFRYESPGVPSTEVIPQLVHEIEKLSLRKPAFVGVQLDIDSPTGSLPQYEAFLKELRKQLPKEVKLSITALLDWFQGNSAIGDVLKEVNEFVPQFYDVAPVEDSDSTGAIGAKIDAARWNAPFNRYGKRFRLGISTFGRARHIPRGPKPGRSYYVRDLLPFDLASNSAFQTLTSRSPAGELVLTYKAARKTSVGYENFELGDAIQFTLPTPESVSTAIRNAHAFTGNMAGVVFFRWPNKAESLAMAPDAVIAIAAGKTPPPARLSKKDGKCAAVSCVDLFLDAPAPFLDHAVTYSIHSAVSFEYFLPNEKIPVRMSGPASLELKLPPYGGQARMKLGRVVTAKQAAFQLEVQ